MELCFPDASIGVYITRVFILGDAELEFTGPASWGPDGTQIVFSAIEPGEAPNLDSTIYLVNADGSGLTERPQMETMLIRSGIRMANGWSFTAVVIWSKCVPTVPVQPRFGMSKGS